jgi:anhydro-N-acetylmuramic acid kinase
VQDLIGSLEGEGAVVAGVLSGTSGDGIDVVLARPQLQRDPRGWRLRGLASVAFETVAFEPDLGARVRAGLDGAALTPRELTLLSRDLGLAFGGAARAVAEAHAVELALVGSHGQTLWHHDDVEPSGPASLQVGDGDWVAEAAGCAVVSDFRQRDLAAGGLGAPLSVLADDVVFAAAARPTAILNLGGMANLSWLPAEGAALAFDTGPAGALLDGLARQLLDQEFDPGGATASRGEVHEELLGQWLAHPFFTAPAPKSTGRDTFGPSWLAKLLAQAAALGVDEPEQLLATGVALVARTVAMGVRQGLPSRPGQLLVAGGGVHNQALMRALSIEDVGTVAPSSVAGVDPDAREALVFAALAVRCVLGEPVSSPSATGAMPGRCLGKISPAAR